MSFFGTEFVFDGIPCSGFQLMVYNIGQSSDSGSKIASTGSIVEGTVSRRWKPYFYGVKQDRKLEFSLTFGVNQHRIDRGAYLSRYEIAEITAWLTGHKQYKVLTVDQPDMREFYFRCMISDLQIVTYGDIPWALQATVVCDSPFAYLKTQRFQLASTDERTFTVRNPSSLIEPYRPIVEITLHAGDSYTIENLSAGEGAMTLTGLPAGCGKIYIDCDKQIIYCESGANLYDCCNLNFLGLVRGENKIKLTGYASVDIVCDFPINTGG